MIQRSRETSIRDHVKGGSVQGERIVKANMNINSKPDANRAPVIPHSRHSQIQSMILGVSIAE